MCCLHPLVIHCTAAKLWHLAVAACMCPAMPLPGYTRVPLPPCLWHRDIIVFQLKKAWMLPLITALQSHQCHPFRLEKEGGAYLCSSGEVTTYLMWTGMSFGKTSCGRGSRLGVSRVQRGCGAKPRQSRDWSPGAEPRRERPEDGSVGQSQEPGPEIRAWPYLSLLVAPLFRPEKKMR